MAFSLLLILVPPLLAAVCLMMPLTRRIGLVLARFAPLPAFVVAVFANPGVDEPISWLLLSTPIGLDATGRAFLLFSALIWLAAGWPAARAESPEQVRFLFHFLLAQTGGLGVCIAQDGIGFYAFFALMTFSAYGLVAHAGDAEARRAGRVYLIFAVAGEVLVLLGLWALAAAAGGAMPTFAEPVPVSWLAAFFILLGFGVKTGLPGLHYALPIAYAVTPPAGAAALAGAMIKAGLLGWLRFLPLGEAAMPSLGAILMLAGVLAIVLSLVGLTQRRVGAVLAYSSIGQMGHFSLAIGAALIAPELWPILLPAVLLYAAHHALVKAALFLGLGSAGAGSARIAHWGWALAALALAGAPLSGGAWAKAAMKAGLASSILPVATFLPVLLTFAAFVTALLMLHAWGLLRRGEAAPTLPAAGGPFAILLAAAWGLPWLAAGGEPPAFWGAILPIVLAALAGGLWLRAGLRLPAWPPGDLWAGMERIMQVAPLGAARFALFSAPVARPKPSSPPTRTPMLEAKMRLWGQAGFVWLGILIAVLASVLILAR